MCVLSGAYVGLCSPLTLRSPCSPCSLPLAFSRSWLLIVLIKLLWWTVLSVFSFIAYFCSWLNGLGEGSPSRSVGFMGPLEREDRVRVQTFMPPWTTERLFSWLLTVIYGRFVSEKQLGTIYGKKKLLKREPFFSDWQDINICLKFPVALTLLSWVTGNNVSPENLPIRVRCCDVDTWHTKQFYLMYRLIYMLFT